MKILLLLSGPSAVGKTTISSALQDAYRFSKVSTSTHLKSVALEKGLIPSKSTLQELGDELDKQTDFAWVANDVATPAFANAVGNERWLLDSVRKRRQVEIFRERYGDAVFHLHLYAPENVLRERYEARARAGTSDEEITPYEQAITHPNEMAARCLREIADKSFDTNSASSKLVIEAIIEECKKRRSHA
ncbi:AAA family ATPase [Pigmentiphaga kullae]|uniref:Guanylate kinase n=1 Tax=Pigmentiphaga kullae TaxID=151784 RepID=A0A4Q7NDS6_9BURK|nr:AAA family ATPase [Pigmentiphaga kullae]RZS81222.1 guanylate kinase [Pigmentiphaga kullae]